MTSGGGNQITGVTVPPGSRNPRRVNYLALSAVSIARVAGRYNEVKAPQILEGLSVSSRAIIRHGDAARTDRDHRAHGNQVS
jgi:hypothetical protein